MRISAVATGGIAVTLGVAGFWLTSYTADRQISEVDARAWGRAAHGQVAHSIGL
jgi:hypothetical protein